MEGGCAHASVVVAKLRRFCANGLLRAATRFGFVSRDGGQQGQQVHRVRTAGGPRAGGCECRVVDTLHVLSLTPGRRRRGQHRLKTSSATKACLEGEDAHFILGEFLIWMQILCSVTWAEICFSFIYKWVWLFLSCTHIPVLLDGWTDIYGHGCFLPTSQPTFSYSSTFKFFPYSVCMLMCRAAGFTSYFLCPGQKTPLFWNCPAGNKSMHIKDMF